MTKYSVLRIIYLHPNDKRDYHSSRNDARFYSIEVPFRYREYGVCTILDLYDKLRRYKKSIKRHKKKLLAFSYVSEIERRTPTNELRSSVIPHRRVQKIESYRYIQSIQDMDFRYSILLRGIQCFMYQHAVILQELRYVFYRK